MCATQQKQLETRAGSETFCSLLREESLGLFFNSYEIASFLGERCPPNIELSAASILRAGVKVFQARCILSRMTMERLKLCSCEMLDNMHVRAVALLELGAPAIIGI